MKIKLHNIIALLGLLCLFACSSKEQYFDLEGTIKGMPEQRIVLEEVGFYEVKLIDSSQSDKSGNFRLKGIYKEPALYRVKLGSQSILVVVDAQKIRIRSDWSDVASYTAEGSAGSASIVAFLKKYMEANKDLVALSMVNDSLNAAAAPDSMLTMVRQDIDGHAAALKDYIRNFSDTTKSLPVALFAVSRLLNDDEETEYLKTFSSGLSKRFGDNNMAREFREKLKEKLAAGQTGAPQVGAMAPDFTLASMDGKPIALNSFRGKYVLVDFWASWCPPCRAENPNVVAAYNKFKNLNFTILGVSLDNNAEKWKEAVAKDGLAWSQVSDLKGWESSVAALYGVQSIPANFLIDPAGRVVGVNLRGDALERTLEAKLNAPPVAAAP